MDEEGEKDEGEWAKEGGLVGAGGGFHDAAADDVADDLEIRRLEGSDRGRRRGRCAGRPGRRGEQGEGIHE